MAGNTFGTIFKLTTFGESHGQAIGGIIDGCPAGLKLDFDAIQHELDRRKPGQSAIVTQRKELDTEYHDILLSGNIPPNPTSLLTHGRFESLIEEAKESYDYIIIDTAPTVLVTDTMLISSFADVTVYIARAGFTEKKILAFSEELFQTGKLKNMAYVINGVGASKSYGYGYNYGYGYGYGYGGSNKKSSKFL